MKYLKRLITKYLAPPFGFLFIFFLGLTCRLKFVNKNAEDSIYVKGNTPVYSFWHGRLLYFPYLYRFRNRLQVLVSPSSDGEIIGNILRLFGFFIIWGSSFKQARRALLTLVRKTKEDYPVVLIADGSRGPVFKAQAGAIYVSMLAGAPILPMTFNADKKSVLNSWDHLLIPHPFSTIVVVFGKPIYVPKRANEEIREEKRKLLEGELNRITDEADSYFDK